MRKFSCSLALLTVLAVPALGGNIPFDEAPPTPPPPPPDCMENCSTATTQTQQLTLSQLAEGVVNLILLGL